MTCIYVRSIYTCWQVYLITANNEHSSDRDGMNGTHFNVKYRKLHEGKIGGSQQPVTGPTALYSQCKNRTVCTPHIPKIFPTPNHIPFGWQPNRQCQFCI